MTDLRVKVFSGRDDVALAIEMHKLRFKVFKGRLDWDVAVSGDMEVDTYDALSPVYLALLSEDNSLLGSARLLPTTGPNMLANTFGELLGGQAAPNAPHIWESSRFCIDTDRTEATVSGGLRRATPAIMAGMGEWALAHQVTEIVTVTDLIVERILMRAGCELIRLGEPMRIGKTKAVACRIEINEAQVQRVRDTGGFIGPVLQPAMAPPVRRRA